MCLRRSWVLWCNFQKQGNLRQELPRESTCRYVDFNGPTGKVQRILSVNIARQISRCGTPRFTECLVGTQHGFNFWSTRVWIIETDSNAYSCPISIIHIDMSCKRDKVRPSTSSDIPNSSSKHGWFSTAKDDGRLPILLYSTQSLLKLTLQEEICCR